MVKDVQETKLRVIYYINLYRQISGNWSCGGEGSKLLLSFSASAGVAIVHPNSFLPGPQHFPYPSASH